MLRILALLLNLCQEVSDIFLASFMGSARRLFFLQNGLGSVSARCSRTIFLLLTSGCNHRRGACAGAGRLSPTSYHMTGSLQCWLLAIAIAYDALSLYSNSLAAH